MRYILRFDDVSPKMAWSKFLPFKAKLLELGIKSVLGVVPHCMDESISAEQENNKFFDYVRQCMKYGDTVAQHGTHHVYCTNSPGILRINNRSEFAGLGYEEQYSKLKKGKEILQNERCWEPHFMAPAHSFDRVTIQALSSLGFETMTDGYGLYPYNIGNILLVPQMFSKPINFGFGISTLCIHINNMSNDEITKLLSFVTKNKDLFINYKDVINLSKSPPLIFYSCITRVVFGVLVPGLRRTKFFLSRIIE